jgi:hypothetical protein
VGWFLASEPPVSQPASDNGSTTEVTATASANSNIRTDVLEALRGLREKVPRLAQKLQPQPPPDHSGMIWADTTNEWGIVMEGTPPETPQQPVEPIFSDTDIRYWKRIATFSTKGELQTLSLGGQRLRQISDPTLLVQPALLESVVTMDLANTDVSLDILCQILKSSSNVQQLYLGGNGLKAQGLDSIAQLLGELSPLQVLDLRYNDIDYTESLASLKQVDQLHLEGNPLGDAGAAALAISTCRELYLGQCRIGPSGGKDPGQCLLNGLWHYTLTHTLTAGLSVQLLPLQVS